MIAIAKDRQNLVDLALMLTGSVEGVWALAERNSLSVTGRLTHGQQIKWDETDVVDPSVVERYAAEGICPATDQ